jgi:FlaA1/EpsC-like NDP-sugar epimerase
MESNPEEAVKNNVFGTWNTARMADQYGVKRFVLISTDKAVNPSNIMGATKRMAEHVISYMNSYSKTRFIAVRFGNVLGSNGSVIPLFQKQISHMGPVTVTHKDMTRFFMTIPEAAMLVLQAATIANEAEIIILDMGHQVRIDEIARTMIRMSGNRPDIDIMIEYTGLRPGEKLHEELFLEEERAERSVLSGIYIGHAMHPEPEEIHRNLEWLLKQLNNPNTDIQKCLMQILSTYRPLDFTEPEESASEDAEVTAGNEADEDDNNMGTCAQRIPLETGNLKYGDIA